MNEENINQAEIHKVPSKECDAPGRREFVGRYRCQRDVQSHRKNKAANPFQEGGPLKTSTAREKPFFQHLGSSTHRHPKRRLPRGQATPRYKSCSHCCHSRRENPCQLRITTLSFEFADTNGWQKDHQISEERQPNERRDQ